MSRGRWKREHELPSFPFHCYTNPFHLLERFAEEALLSAFRPRTGELMLIKKTKLHGVSFVNTCCEPFPVGA
jgi:hypothetical protein